MSSITTTNRALRPQVIAVAQTRGALLAEQGYTFECCAVSPDEQCEVTSPEGAHYFVWMPGKFQNYPEGRCTCPQWKSEGVCKHIYGAMQEPHDHARYSRMEAEQDERNTYAIAVAACVEPVPYMG